ncbi:MAG: peptide-N-glycosidase F-related protein [Bacteroidales bacterium]|nr:peptide-N-glycosidase F-related protein [Bacteroidales bacterium]
MLLCIVLSSMSLRALSQSNDTITVQTFTFGSPQDAWFQFPADTVRFEKILMLYTLKCNPAQNPACGEWDYLTYTYLHDHTGLTDSSIVHQPVYLVNGNIKDTFSFVNNPTYSYQTGWHYNVVHDDTTSLNTFVLGNDSIQSVLPFASSSPVSRTQYLWKASELTVSGMVAGNITGIQFDIHTSGSELKNLVLRMLLSPLDSLSQNNFNNIGFTEVYRHNTLFASNGWQSLQFLTPFYWDGTSNIILDVCFDNSLPGSDNIVKASDVAFQSSLFRKGDDRCISIHNGGYVNVPMNSDLKQIDSLITVSFWAYGDALLQPQNGSCFEAVDTNGNRVLNAHVPWSDNSIYWDAGNDGSSFDRINKAATADIIKGRWNYWSFTKNVTSGSMKIYLNGVLWHSGNSKLRSFKEITKFHIGKGTENSSQSYEGRMDEFAVFNTELNQSAIQNHMQKGITTSDQYYNNLVVYYKFNDNSYISAIDSAPANHSDAIFTSIGNPMKNAIDYVSDFTTSSLRPNVNFQQGIFTSHIDSVFVLDSAVNTPVQIITYTDSIYNPGLPVDTLNVWLADYYTYLYNASGIITDSVYVSPDSTMILSYYDYYKKFPQVIRYELARYITPYGNGLSLGSGWTWTFDVTDYRTLLSDSVHLTAGNWQELLDMRFVMIKGTPPRDVIGIQNLWNGGFNYGQTADPIENHLIPKQVYIPSNAQTARWKSRITGHGMDTPQNCSEFCAKNHFFKVNDSLKFTQLVWRNNCDLNPLYPQGGTWVYDRANWCPGAEVWTYDFEITPFITAGDSITLDHDVQPYTSTGGWNYYQIEDQLVTYGAPNFILDAAIENVLSPTKDQMWGRLNPICKNPSVIIKNNGITNLTSLDITYGITGANTSVFHWTGLLKFTETATVQLDTFAWMQGATTFTTTISNPNGGTDQYTNNNTRTTPFTYVPVMPSKFMIEFKTNNYPSQNAFTLSDNNGNIILSRSGLTANTIYRDTLELTDGCYEFKLTDTGEDGLTWWANTSQGNGYLRFKSAYNPTILKNFNSDFGGEVYMQFTVGLSSNVEDYIFTNKPELKIYPNPASNMVFIDFDLPARESGSIEVYDVLGHLVHSFLFTEKIAENLILDVESFTSGVYIIILKTNNYSVSKKLICGFN